MNNEDPHSEAVKNLRNSSKPSTLIRQEFTKSSPPLSSQQTTEYLAKKNKYAKTAAVIIGVLSLTALMLIYKGDLSDKSPAGFYDDFAKCLSEKGIEMYGKTSCSFCQKEKLNFGDSFKFINYVDCSADPQKCVAKGINLLPTWIFPNDKKLEGLQGLQKLSEESGCALPLN